MEGPLEESEVRNFIEATESQKLDQGQELPLFTALPLSDQLSILEKIIENLPNEINKFQIPKILTTLCHIKPEISELTNCILWQRMLKLISFILSNWSTNLHNKHLNDFIMLFINKTTNISLKTDQNCHEKLEQIKIWKIIKRNVESEQFCIAVSSYLIGLFEIVNIEQAMILIYFAIESKLGLPKERLLEFSELIWKCIVNHYQPNKFSKEMSKKIITTLSNQINTVNIDINIIFKLFTNLFVLLLKDITDELDIRWLIKNKNFGILKTSLLLTFSSLEKDIQNRKWNGFEKEELFISVCKFYMATGEENILQLIQKSVQIEVSCTMIWNLLNILNYDFNSIRLSKQENITRLNSILKVMKNECNESKSECFLTEGNSWVSKLIGKTPSVVVLKLRLYHSYEKNPEKSYELFAIQMEKEAFSLFFKFKKTENFSTLVEIFVKNEQNKKSDKIKVLDEFEICDLILEFKVDNKLCINGQNLETNFSGKSFRIHFAAGFEHAEECGVKSIKEFLVFEGITCQTLNEEKNKLVKPNNLRREQEKHAHSRKPKSENPLDQKYNIFEHLENCSIDSFSPSFEFGQKKPKLFSAFNIVITKSRSFDEIFKLLKGNECILSFLMRALEQMSEINLLEYIRLIKNQIKEFKISEKNYNHFLFVYGFYLESAKVSETILTELIEFITIFSEHDQENEIERCFWKLELILNTLLKIGLENWRNKAIEVVNLLAIKSLSELSITKVLKNLNYFLFNLINDEAVQHSEDKISIKRPSSKKFISLFIETIRSCIMKISSYFEMQTNYKIYSQLVSECIISHLQFAIIVLLYISAPRIELEIENMQIILQENQKVLHFLIQILITKGIAVTDSGNLGNKICSLLSQLYNLLPYMSRLRDVGKTEGKEWNRFEEEFCSIYMNSNERKDLEFYPTLSLMEKYYTLAVNIGSFYLKDKKLGLLTYVYYAIQHIKDFKLNFEWNQPSLEPNDKVCIMELYAACWKFLLGVNCNSEDSSMAQFDQEEKIELMRRLVSLKIPIYYFSLGKEANYESLIEAILTFFTVEEQRIGFPIFTLSNISSSEMEKVLTRISNKITMNKKFKLDLKEEFEIHLIKIAMIFPKYCNFELTTFAKSNNWMKHYKWFLLMNQTKALAETLQQQNQTQSQNSPNIFTKLIENIKKLLEEIREFAENYEESKLETFASILLSQCNLSSEEKVESHMLSSFYLPLILSIDTECMNVTMRCFYKEFYVLPELAIENKIEPIDLQNYFYLGKSKIEENENEHENGNVKSMRRSVEKADKKIFIKNRNYFLDMFSNLAKSKTLSINGYCQMIEKLSSLEKIELGRLNKYLSYEYFNLDDFLNSQSIKTMLKQDYILMLNNAVSSKIPLLKEKITDTHFQYAIEITQKEKTLNKFPYIEELFKNKKKEETNEFVKASIKCLLITKSKIYQGVIDITNDHVMFLENSKIDRAIYEVIYANPSEKRTEEEIAAEKKEIKIKISEICYSQKKEYLQKFEALEVYTSNLSFFFVFSIEDDRKKFLTSSKIFFKQPYESEEEVNEVQNQWQKGWISNFELLIILNNIAGRSLNDLSQYYIFPWTVKNFKGQMSPNFLTNQVNFRDLTEPIGMISGIKSETIITNYKNNSKEEETKDNINCMFGSFYSNAGIISNFLLRVNPFTGHHYQIQGNHFDLLERLFVDLESQFESVESSTSDNRELVPEFYCAPEFFRNRNQVNFASNPSEKRIALEMKFPEWVITKTPEEFVLKMRMCLESDLISSKLGNWIDLIFGKKSEYVSAAENKNLYLFELYKNPFEGKGENSKENSFNNDSFVDRKSHMIKQFGQVPINIYGQKKALPTPQHKISQSITNKLEKTLVLPSLNKSPRKPIFDMSNNLLAMVSQNILIFMNTIEEAVPIKEELDEEVVDIAIIFLKKSQIHLIFIVSVSGKLSVAIVKLKESFFMGKWEYKIKSIIPIQEGNFSKVKVSGNHVIAVEDNLLVFYKIKSEKDETISSIELLQGLILEKIDSLLLHKSNINNLQIYESLGLIVSIDEQSFINVCNFTPEISVRATFKIGNLKVSEFITKILIHEIGLLVLLTSNQKLLIYNIYGDLLTELIPPIKSIVDIEFFDSLSSADLLISSKFGKLYKIDLFELSSNLQEIKNNEISPCMEEFKMKQKENNLIRVHRFGRFWRIFLMGSQLQIDYLECDESFGKNFFARKFMNNCNDNTSKFKNK